MLLPHDAAFFGALSIFPTQKFWATFAARVQAKNIG
jgi:hypothetical protein